MNVEIKQIAERIKGLLEVMDISQEECAKTCHITVEQLEKYESGTVDIPVGFLSSLASSCNMELYTLVTGDVPRMHTYSVTRKGTGSVVKRRNEYDYQSLNDGYIGKKALPFIVTVKPDDIDNTVPLYRHEGQEFNLILEGKLKLVINSKKFILNEGDSIWFDSSSFHGMKSLDHKECKFLAMIFK